jgi:hypothetical protein
MTGGVPYGRPLPDRAADRDGLTLDQLRVRVGPFWHPLPPGLVLDVDLQGDVLQRAGLPPGAYVPSRTTGGRPDVFIRSLFEPISIAEIELARARSHLRRLAEAVTLHGLDALGTRILRLAIAAGPADAEQVEALQAPLRRSGFLGWATAGVGVLHPDDLAGMGLGPNARSCGLHEDVRLDDPAYRALGFEPIVHSGGDLPARWRQRLAESVQSLRLADLAGDRTTGQTGRVESPRGRLEAGSAPTSRLLYLLPRILEGLEWGDAVATIVSLDADLDELRAHESALKVEAAP